MAPMTKKPMMMYKIQPHPDCAPCIRNSNIALIIFRIHPKMLQPTNRKPISKIAPMIYNIVIALNLFYIIFSHPTTSNFLLK